MIRLFSLTGAIASIPYSVYDSIGEVQWKHFLCFCHPRCFPSKACHGLQSLPSQVSDVSVVTHGLSWGLFSTSEDQRRSGQGKTAVGMGVAAELLSGGASGSEKRAGKPADGVLGNVGLTATIGW